MQNNSITSVKTRLFELRQILSLTKNSKAKVTLEKKIKELEKELGKDETIYQL